MSCRTCFPISIRGLAVAIAERKTIALVFDCDETLCNDTTDFLLLELGQDPIEFWQQVAALVKTSHWDPPLAYMMKLLDLMETTQQIKTFPQLRKYLLEVGSKVEFYDGVKEMLAELRKTIQQETDYQEAGVNLEFFVVSGGLEELIEGTHLTAWNFRPENIVACSFGEGNNGKPTPKSIITFTEKTKYLYAINKGIPFPKLRGHPDFVNVHMELDERPIPFENVIYVGDGLSDIPCFSMLNQYGGVGVGVFSERAYSRGYQLAVSRRIMAGPYRPVYSSKSDIRLFLEQRIKAVADSIVAEMHGKLGAPESSQLGLRLQMRLDGLRKEAAARGISLPGVRLQYQRALRPPRALSTEEEIELLRTSIAALPPPEKA